MEVKHLDRADGGLTGRIEEYASAAHARLTQFVAIHDDIFAAPFWRSIRRLIPIPGIFQRIPYGRYAVSVGELQRATDSIAKSCREQLEHSSGSEVERRALWALVRYCEEFSRALQSLHLICAGLARKVEEQEGPSLAEYNSQVAEYERYRKQSIELGGDLNSALAHLRQSLMKDTP